ncbi:unnamed protein product [Sphagnum troendelagicum]|uniref:Protein kinase domain-containing protein n=1 Tax=Sphagnum troendelagicum TaxID=128251 RepID=A0ABP0UPK2_9BRYO
MCMMKRMRINIVFKQTTLPSTSSSPAASHKARRTKVKAQGADDSSMEQVSGTTTISSHELSKESQVSSTGSSATSLAGIKDMLSDGAIIFKLKDLSKATENFRSARKVGTSVFRGSVHGMDVAIVVIKNLGFAAGTSSTSITADFVAEMKNLCSVHHTNLVKLIGGCNSGSQVYLVYEFIDTGNLRQYLHSQYAPGFSALPTWTGRLQVVLDVAKGLEYLHHHTHNAPFVHKHLNSSNILLDSELHARIAYFGVAKIRGETDTIRSHSIKISGTHGYMAPEEKSGGIITPKVDVFAFGVILLEILSGKEAVSFQIDPDTNTFKKTLLPDVIVAIFADKDPGRRLRPWMDPLLRDSAPLDCALKTAELAKDCVNPDPELRPEMTEVALALSKILMNSQAWEKKILAGRGVLTSTIQPR